MRWWKILGVAAFAGVAAGGVLIVTDERRRAAYTPDEIRDRLHSRLTEATASRPHPDPEVEEQVRS